MFSMTRLFVVVMTVLITSVWLPAGAEADTFGRVDIPVSVLAEGSEPDWNAVYTVELIPQDPDCPMPEGSRDGRYRMALKGGSTGVIYLDCQTPGEYAYCLRQIPGKDQDCSYDLREFRLEITVTENVIETEAADPEGNTVDEILFRNRWAEPAWVVFSSWVSMDSLPPKDSAFSCLLLMEDGQKIARIGNQGKHVVFPALRFAEEGVYRYIMKEVAEPGEGVVYDRAVYTMTVTVHREKDYLAEVSCARNGEAYTGTPCFFNYTEGSIPKTGDGIGIWVAVMLLSAASLLGILGVRRKAAV